MQHPACRSGVGAPHHASCPRHPELLHNLQVLYSSAPQVYNMFSFPGFLIRLDQTFCENTACHSHIFHFFPLQRHLPSSIDCSTDNDMLSRALDSLEHFLHRQCLRSKFFNTKNWEYACLVSGLLSFLMAFFVLVAAGFLPPLSPTLTGEQLQAHYFAHKKGMHASVPLLLISGGLYLPYGALLCKQLRQIPNIDPIIPDLQLAAVAASIFSVMVPATFFGMTVFRDYGPELTRFLSDLLWLSFFCPWPTFWVQSWTIAWAAFSDNSEDPIFPKTAALVNFCVPLTYFSFFGIHIEYTGPYAWDGALTFWLPAVAFGIQVGMDCHYMFKNIRRTSKETCQTPETDMEVSTMEHRNHVA
jgi:hypothetical protein